MNLYQTLKDNSKLIGCFLLVVLAALIIGFFIGKNSLPAKVETEIVEKEEKKEAIKEMQVANVKKTTKTVTAKDGTKTELTFDEMNYASETNSETETKKQSELSQVVKNNMLGVYYIPNYALDDKALNHAVFIEYGHFGLFGNLSDKWKVQNVGLAIGFRF